MQHRVWGVMLWRKWELVLGLLVVLGMWKELGFLLCQQVTVLLQGLSKEAEFRGCCHLEVNCGRQHSDVGLSETIEKCFFRVLLQDWENV